jgi:hypothetical protein
MNNIFLTFLPQTLGGHEINIVLIQIGLTFGFVELNLVHEYK